MNSPAKITVLLAPALAADRSLSMDLYLSDLQAALAPFSDRFQFEVVAPRMSPGESWLARQWQRYIAYPGLLSRRLLASRGAVLHVLDQSYGHLCRSDIPTVLTCHGLENFRLKLKLFWQQALWAYRVRCMRRARRIVAISAEVAADAQRFANVPQERIVLDYYGINPVFAAGGDLLPLLKDRRAAGDLLVLHVGVNFARKNIGLLLEALARLRAKGLPIRFVKAGYDPRKDGYLPQMQRLGLLEHIDFVGLLDAQTMACVYRSCHVLAFPSVHEGFGRPMIEAQACGLPVVAADTTSAREIAGSGALFHTIDATDLAAKIRPALTDPDLRARLVSAGLQNVRRFSWAEHARVLTDIYAQLHADPA